MEEAVKKDIREVVELMQMLASDRSVPRNVRTIIENAKEKMEGKKVEGTDCSQAIYMLDDISNDINMPSHARTDLWEIVSKLEAVKEKVK